MQLPKRKNDFLGQTSLSQPSTAVLAVPTAVTLPPAVVHTEPSKTEHMPTGEVESSHGLQRRKVVKFAKGTKGEEATKIAVKLVI